MSDEQKQVDRFKCEHPTFGWDRCHAQMEKDNAGEWVRFEDYERLEKRLAESEADFGNQYAHLNQAIESRNDAIAKLQAENAALKADAERYRWLREQRNRQ